MSKSHGTGLTAKPTKERNWGWFALEQHLFVSPLWDRTLLGSTALLTYISLRLVENRYTHTRNQSSFFATHEKIAETAHLGASTTGKALRLLMATGIVWRLKRGHCFRAGEGRASVYRLPVPSRRNLNLWIQRARDLKGLPQEKTSEQSFFTDDEIEELLGKEAKRCYAATRGRRCSGQQGVPWPRCEFCQKTKRGGKNEA